jgi:hypothetical protein
MKKGTAFIGFLLFNVFSISFIKSAIAEKYICSAELSSHGRPGEVETKTYKREGNSFLRTNKNGQYDHSILKETNSFIILTKTYNYPDLFITIIDKKKLNFIEAYASIELEYNTEIPTSGKCFLAR